MAMLPEYFIDLDCLKFNNCKLVDRKMGKGILLNSKHWRISGVG